MNLTKFSEIVSRIFDPLRILPLVFVVIAFNVGLTGTQIRFLFPTIFTINILIPLLIFLILKKRGEFSDIDISKRQERYRFFGLLTLAFFVSTIVLFLWGNKLSYVLNLILFISTGIVWLVTFKFKISGHLAFNVAVIFMINFIFNWEYVWLILLVPTIGFSRVYLKKHTFLEVLAGVFVGIFIPYIILKSYGLI